MRHLLLALTLFIGSSSNSLVKAQSPVYEFRGVWIATVDNIDWPPRGESDPARQRAAFIKQLDMHKRNGMNAVIVQVRPSADAFYASSYEPWSQWLTGKQGQAPSPFYDPLEFMIKETHKRGMEFHAWCNPYRAELKVGSSSIAASNIMWKHPEWYLTYGNKRYFNPANKEAQDFVVKVIADIVKRYDIDAIHMDDYFYPYRIHGKEFPDAPSYFKSGSKLSKDDWRRSNVDSIIKKLDIAIKAEKPYVKFGISPFGVWRNADKDPGGSKTRAGLTNYDDLYADILLWLQNKWIDYVTPQLYWEIGHKLADYTELVNWWSQHGYGRHIYIGHGIYRATEKSAPWKNPNELPNQIKMLRKHPEIQGSIYYSSKSFNNNPNGWNDSLQNNYYKAAAKIPVMEWLPAKPGTTPVAGKTRPATKAK